MPISTTSGLTGYPAVWLTAANRRLEKQFTAVERTGYLTVTDLIRDFLTDAVTGEAAFRVANVSITETFKANVTNWTSNRYLYQQNDVPFPPTQRIRKIVSGGAGYAVGDELFYTVDHARANVKIIVTRVDSESKNEVLDFEVFSSGHYNLTPPSANKKFNFRPRKNPYIFPTLQKDISYATYLSPSHFVVPNSQQPFYFQGRHEGTGTGGPTVVVPSYNIAFTSTTGQTPAHVNDLWELQFGEDGGGGSTSRGNVQPYIPNPALSSWVTDNAGLDISQPGTDATGNYTRWPGDGLWANVKLVENTRIVPGAEIILDLTTSNAQSFINPGTIITSVDGIEVVDGQKFVRSYPTGLNTTNEYTEKTGKYVWFTVNQSVKVDKGDRFFIKGNGLVISDDTTQNNTAEYFKVIVESQGRIDPHAENKESVTATVNKISGNAVYLTNLTHSVTAWYPTVFEGHEIETSATSLYLGMVANVANVKIGAGSTGSANIVTDVTLPSAIEGTSVRLRFSSNQGWRMAFEALGKQTMNIYAATAVQLRDDGNIAKVTDYTGTITDLSGLIGNVPSIPILSSDSAEVATVNVTLNPGSAGSGNSWVSVTNHSGAPIQPGYMIDYTKAGSTVPRDAVILEQRLPLITGETIGKIGIYKISNVVVTSSTETSIKIAKVLTRELDQTDITQGFVNRTLRVAEHPESYPLSYYASFTNRGIFFGVWEGTWSIMQKSRSRQISERDAWFNWVLVQRPVNRKTGLVRTSGQSPVFCINSVGYKYWKFIVRERDVMHPTQGDRETKYYSYNDITGNIDLKSSPYRVPADAHTDDSHAVLNSTNQIALTEDSKYLVSFLYNLTTPRFRYSDELDMIGQTAGDVSMASSDIKITAYGEATQRVYKSLAANLPYNAGLRICVIKDIYV